jgi:hypothetical protein
MLFVADAYYAAGKVVLTGSNPTLLPTCPSNRLGGPRRRGNKTKLQSLFSDTRSVVEVTSPV